MKSCSICGAELSGLQSKFCSRKCSKKFHAPPRQNQFCVECGKENPPGRGTYCSQRCQVNCALRRRRKSGYDCVICGTTIPSHYQKYCSKECRYEAAKAKLRTGWVGKVLDCKQCGKQFTQRASIQAFCSERCMFRFNYEHRPKKSRAKPLHKKQCPVCHIQFMAKANRLYCSDKCARKSPKAIISRKRSKQRSSRARSERQRARYRFDPEYREKMLNRSRLAFKNNPILRIRQCLRKRVREFLRSKVNGISALVGCNSAELRQWIESQWNGRMTWDNYGKYWVVDHKIPLSSFNLEEPRQREIACHYTNLQPLTREKNQEKAANITDPQLPLRI